MSKWRLTLVPILPLASPSLLGVGVDTSVWVCVMLGVECSVCSRVIGCHTKAISRQRTGAWQLPRAMFVLQVK